MTRVTLREVAQAAGVSPSSVSRILNDAPTYTHDARTQAHVRAVAERLNYRANAAARLLKQQKKTLVGLAAHFSYHPYSSQLLAAARDQLLQHEYEPVLMEPALLATGYASNSTSISFPSPDILAGVLSFGEESCRYSESMQSRLPLVSLHPLATREVNWIFADDTRGIEMLVDHLVELGHRRIAFALSSKSPFPTDRLKLRGWKRAVRRHRLTAAEATCIEVANYDDSDERAAQIEAALLAMKPRPTALMNSGDESALCVLARLQKRGWNIPRDLSITGYDGIVFSRYVWPQITTILQPAEEIARQGVERLLQMINQSPADKPRQVLIEPQLLTRVSTAPPPSEC